MADLVLGDAPPLAQRTELVTTDPRPLGKIHSTIRLGNGEWIEVRRGWIDHEEHVGLGFFVNGQLVHGIVVPRRALVPLSEAFADVVRYLGLSPAPIPGQLDLF